MCSGAVRVMFDSFGPSSRAKTIEHLVPVNQRCGFTLSTFQGRACVGLGPGMVFNVAPTRWSDAPYFLFATLDEPTSVQGRRIHFLTFMLVRARCRTCRRVQYRNDQPKTHVSYKSKLKYEGVRIIACSYLYFCLQSHTET